LFEHDLFGKPASTFPDHAREKPRVIGFANEGRKTMARATLGLEQAAALVGRMKAAAEGGGSFSDLVMPNGQKLKDCTFGYVAEVGEAMRTMGWSMPDTLGPA
jgi:hypothetical protein